MRTGSGNGLGLRGWATVSVVGLGAAVGPLDTSVNIAFPDITGGFGKPLGAIQWVIICYVLTYASLLLNLGRFADIAGHRRVFVGGLIASVVGLAMCGLAPSYEWLLVARAAQGVGTGAILATGPALITLSFPESLRARALGGYAMFLSGAMAVGPLLGGVLVSTWGWPAVFWFRVPIAIVISVLALVILRAPPAGVRSGRFDFAGALTLSVALVSTLLTLNRASTLGWGSPTTLGLAVVAIVSGVSFVRIELRAPAPVIHLALFARRQFSIANVANVLAQLASFTVFLLGPYFLVGYMEGRVAQAGLLLGVSPVGGAITAIIAGRLLGQHSAWALSTIGLGLIATGLTGVTFWTPDTGLPVIVGTLIVNGIGLGLFQVSNLDYVMGSVPRSQQGVAGALTTLTRTIGVVLGASLGSVIFTELGGVFPSEGGLTERFIGPYTQVFGLAAGVSAFAALVMLFGGRETRGVSERER